MKHFLILSMIFLIACSGNDEDQWVFVEGGSFLQGEQQFIISPDGDTIEGFTSPRRTVYVGDFYMSKYEVTVAEFKAYCEASGYPMPEPPLSDAFGYEGFAEWQDDLPMLATWFEADAYAKWAGGRLPTEAEWEYAAKGGKASKGYRYSGSDDAREIGWVRENADSSLHPVGHLKANELGLYDMTGNVSEWVHDWYNPSIELVHDTIDPKGATLGSDKISKGLSFFYSACNRDGTPLSNGIHLPEVRYQSPPSTRNDGFGFRIVKDK